MTNNLANIVMTLITNGQNPNEVLNNLIQKNPQYQFMMNQMKQSGMNIKDFTLQYAKQNNINLEPTIKVLENQGIKL